MTTQQRYLLVGTVVLVCLGVGLSFVYPFSTATPQSEADDRYFTTDGRDEYTVTAETTLDGETVAELNGTITAEGSRYVRMYLFNFNETVEMYRATSTETVYDRHIHDRPVNVTEVRERFGRIDTRTIVREEHNDEDVTFMVQTKTNRSGVVTKQTRGWKGLFISYPLTIDLSLLSYERVDERDGIDVYEPQNGWYNGSNEYRITGATGRVHVDNETQAVRSATVSFAYTPASNYAEYLETRLTTNRTRQIRITYDVADAVEPVDPPSWLPNTKQPLRGNTSERPSTPEPSR